MSEPQQTTQAYPGFWTALAFWFKLGWLTLGGAYAVLPYVFQAAVVQYQWLLASQM